MDVIPRKRFLSLPVNPSASYDDGILEVLRAYPNNALTEKEIAWYFGLLEGDILTDTDNEFLKSLGHLVRDGSVQRRYLGATDYFAVLEDDGEAGMPA